MDVHFRVLKKVRGFNWKNEVEYEYIVQKGEKFLWWFFWREVCRYSYEDLALRNANFLAAEEKGVEVIWQAEVKK